MRRSSLRPLAALIAAYAIALQAMLAGMLLASQAGHAASIAGIMCSVGPSEPANAPEDSMPCCTGAMCNPSASDPDPAPVVATPRVLEWPLHRPLARADRPLRLAAPTPQQPRAPPLS